MHEPNRPRLIHESAQANFQYSQPRAPCQPAPRRGTAAGRWLYARLPTVATVLTPRQGSS